MLDRYLYRREDVAYVLGALANGECVSVVGMSNVGKSSFMRSLRSPEVIQQLGGDLSVEDALIYIDFNLMWEMTDQGFYEVILRGLTSQPDCLPASDAIQDRVRAAYQSLIAPSSPFLVPVSFNEALAALSASCKKRLVLLLDEFDEPWASIDRRAFLNLRALRDRYQGALCYVTATTHPLGDIRTGREIGEFCELFSHHACYLGPLDDADARQYISACAQSLGAAFDERDLAFIQGNAGGHPGLLETISRRLAEAKAAHAGIADLSAAHYARLQELLDGDAEVRTECAKLWNDLVESEQEALLALASKKGQPDRSALASLERKRLLRDLDGGLVPFSRLLAGFARRQQLVRHGEARGVRVNVESGEVSVDGRLLPDLTELEYKLLLLLYGNLNKICDKYRIVEAVWGESFIETVDDARIEKLVSRVRQKLGENPENPRYLVTVRGRGYRLAGPEM
jgi:hypothetical protein